VCVYPGCGQTSGCIIYFILLKDIGYPMKELIARSGSDMSLDNLMPAEIINFMPGIKQVIWIIRF
jgi:hypothetical protein